MRRVGFLLALLALPLAGCVISQTVEFPGKDYHAVFNATVGAMCAEKRIIVYNADSEQGIVHFVFRNQMGHPELQVLVEKGAAGPTVTIPFAPNPENDVLIDAINRNLSSGKGAPAAAPAGGVPAPRAVPADTSGAPATPAPAPAAPDTDRKKPLL